MILWYQASEFPQWIQDLLNLMATDSIQEISRTLSIIKQANGRTGLSCWEIGTIPTLDMVPPASLWTRAPYNPVCAGEVQ